MKVALFAVFIFLNSCASFIPPSKLSLLNEGYSLRPGYVLGVGFYPGAEAWEQARADAVANIAYQLKKIPLDSIMAITSFSDIYRFDPSFLSDPYLDMRCRVITGFSNEEGTWVFLAVRADAKKMYFFEPYVMVFANNNLQEYTDELIPIHRNPYISWKEALIRGTQKYLSDNLEKHILMSFQYNVRTNRYEYRIKK